MSMRLRAPSLVQNWQRRPSQGSSRLDRRRVRKSCTEISNTVRRVDSRMGNEGCRGSIRALNNSGSDEMAFTNTPIGQLIRGRGQGTFGGSIADVNVVERCVSN